VTTHGQAEVSLAADLSSNAGARQRHGSGLALCAYSIEAGISSTAVGAWASSGLSGLLRAAVWGGVTTVLGIVAVCLAGPAIKVLDRCFRITLSHRNPHHR
jgi:hypothetical protein